MKAVLYLVLLVCATLAVAKSLKRVRRECPTRLRRQASESSRDYGYSLAVFDYFHHGPYQDKAWMYEALTSADCITCFSSKRHYKKSTDKHCLACVTPFKRYNIHCGKCIGYTTGQEKNCKQCFPDFMELLFTEKDLANSVATKKMRSFEKEYKLMDC